MPSYFQFVDFVIILQVCFFFLESHLSMDFNKLSFHLFDVKLFPSENIFRENGLFCVVWLSSLTYKKLVGSDGCGDGGGRSEDNTCRVTSYYSIGDGGGSDGDIFVPI